MTGAKKRKRPWIVTASDQIWSPTANLSCQRGGRTAHVARPRAGPARGERGELAASSLALTSVLRQRGEKVPAFVCLFAAAKGRREGERLGEGPCPPPGSGSFVPRSRCEGKLLSLDECACGCGCPRFFHGRAGNQSEAAFLNSRPAIPGNKRAQEGAAEQEWGWFGNSSAGPLLI